MMWEKKNKKRLEKEWLDWFLSDNVTLLKTSNNSMQVAKHSFLPDKTKLLAWRWMQPADCFPL